jgi:hypothetical protein
LKKTAALFLIFIAAMKKNQEFIVELQRAKQEHFQDRAAYYSSFLIQDQAKKGKWDFEFTPIYFIGLLDFSLASFPDDNYLHFGQITDIYSQEVMFKKLNFIYIEMAKFKKQESDTQIIWNGGFIFCAN